MWKQDLLDRLNRLREPMIGTPAVCIQRGLYMTQSYRETEGEAEVIRRAKAFARVLDNLTRGIGEDELLVGRITGKVRAGAISPELQSDWYLNELDLLSTRPSDRFLPLTEEEKSSMREFIPYWYGKSLRDRWNAQIPEEARPVDAFLLGGGAFCGNNQYYGHSSPGYERMLQKGVRGLEADIEERIARLDWADPEQFLQYQELTAMKLCLDALVRYAHSYADLAEELARTAGPDRKAELLEIARICRKVPEEPASTFAEAIQCVWFTYLGVMMENWGTGVGFLRADQYLWPYFQADLAAGRITEEDAFARIAMLLIKCNEAVIVYNEHSSHGFAGHCSGANFTLGGVTPEGACAVNRLSYLFLEAERVVALNSEDLVVRVTRNEPKSFLILACEVARDVGGKLKFVGDSTLIQQMLSDGRPVEMARDYAVVGCTSPTVGGQSFDYPGGMINMPLLLELALNDGVSRITGFQLGPKTGDPRRFSTFEEVWEAFLTQLKAVIPYCHLIKNLDKQMFAAYAPSPYLSTLYAACVDRGLDVIRGGTSPQLSSALALCSVPNVGDSLAALKRVVFEEERLTMGQVIDALDHNFEGYEDVRRMLAKAPKFGNNDPYADDLVNQVLCTASDLIAAVPGYLGARSVCSATAVTANVGLGMLVGALPDGRLAEMPLSEGGLSPYQGRNVSGITATLTSVARMNHMKLRHGSVLNLRLDPNALRDEGKIVKLCDMLYSYFDQGGFLVQFNIVRTETLRDAQRHPELYRDLSVRVATYAAYFVDLGRELQEDIISRLEFETL